jgi:Tfp pilus assembly protein PilX
MYRSRGRGPRSRARGCLLLIVLAIAILIVIALAFGGFQKGTKSNGLAPLTPSCATCTSAPTAA